VRPVASRVDFGGRAASTLRSRAEGLDGAAGLRPVPEPVVTSLHVVPARAAVATAVGLFTRWALTAMAVGARRRSPSRTRGGVSTQHVRRVVRARACVQPVGLRTGPPAGFALRPGRGLPASSSLSVWKPAALAAAQVCRLRPSFAALGAALQGAATRWVSARKPSARRVAFTDGERASSSATGADALRARMSNGGATCV
jgi:hypothetical protein